MQDRYAGDVGDFGKLGMLRKIADTGLTVGVNWYRTYKPEESGRDDGKHVGYLYDRKFEGCDDPLLESLRIVVKGHRSVFTLMKADLITRARYYTGILMPGNIRSFSRADWHKDALKALNETDVVFCDPDNGLLVDSVSLRSLKSDKYITADELADYYSTGKSVVFYNHRCRQKEPVYLQRFQALRQRRELNTAKWIGLKYARGTTRDYFFILQPSHAGQVTTAMAGMLQSKWNKHFSSLDI